MLCVGLCFCLCLFVIWFVLNILLVIFALCACLRVVLRAFWLILKAFKALASRLGLYSGVFVCLRFVRFFGFFVSYFFQCACLRVVLCAFCVGCEGFWGIGFVSVVELCCVCVFLWFGSCWVIVSYFFALLVVAARSASVLY